MSYQYLNKNFLNRYFGNGVPNAEDAYDLTNKNKSKLNPPGCSPKLGYNFNECKKILITQHPQMCGQDFIYCYDLNKEHTQFFRDKGYKTKFIGLANQTYQYKICWDLQNEERGIDLK